MILVYRSCLSSLPLRVRPSALVPSLAQPSRSTHNKQHTGTKQTNTKKNKGMQARSALQYSITLRCPYLSLPSFFASALPCDFVLRTSPLCRPPASKHIEHTLLTLTTPKTRESNSKKRLPLLSSVLHACVASLSPPHCLVVRIPEFRAAAFARHAPTSPLTWSQAVLFPKSFLES